MADYYPLLARAVGSLNPNTSEQRRALYDRARKTLVDQLRKQDPTLANTDVKAESAALDAAIQRVERDFMRRAAPPPASPPRQSRPGPVHEAAAEAAGYRDLPPLTDTGKRWRILAGVGVVALLLIGGVAAYTYLPRSRQLVYYRTNQPVGTLVVDKTQTFLYVVRPNVSALRYNIGVGPECIALSGLYRVVRKEEPAKQSGDALGARVLYLDKDYRIPLESRVVVAN